MDLKQLRLAQTRQSTKFLILALLSLQVGVGLFCAYLFMGSPTAESSPLVQAAAYSLGAGIPLFALALLVLTARSDTRSVEARKHEVFLGDLPYILRRIDIRPDTAPGKMAVYQGKALLAKRIKPELPDIAVHVGLASNGSTAHYRLEAQCFDHLVELWMSIDLKINQATVCLLLPESSLEPGEKIADQCTSTVCGARTSGGYEVDSEEDETVIGDQRFRRLIMRRRFSSEDFLWERASTFGFVEDLGLMVASFIRECAPRLVMRKST